MIEKRDLMRRLGISEKQIRIELNLSYIQYHNFNHRVPIDRTHIWTDDEVRFLIECYSVRRTRWDDIADDINTKFGLTLTACQVKNKFYASRNEKSCAKFFENITIPASKPGRRPKNQGSKMEEQYPPKKEPESHKYNMEQKNLRSQCRNLPRITLRQQLSEMCLKFNRVPSDPYWESIIRRAKKICSLTDGETVTYIPSSESLGSNLNINTYRKPANKIIPSPFEELCPVTEDSNLGMDARALPSTSGLEFVEGLGEVEAEQELPLQLE